LERFSWRYIVDEYLALNRFICMLADDECCQLCETCWRPVETCVREIRDKDVCQDGITGLLG